MFEREIRLYRLMLQYLQSIVKDLDESQLILPIGESINPPAWILGHLAIVNDSALRILGAAPVCSSEWRAAFGMGKKPNELTIMYPGKNELMEKIVAGHALVCEAARSADPAAMDKPHSFPFFKDSPLETVGDLLAHV